MADAVLHQLRSFREDEKWVSRLWQQVGDNRAVGRVSIMQLIFEGHSTIERGFDGVKFVGCCREARDRDRYVPCRVTREALDLLVLHTLDGSAQALLNAYQSKSEIINRIASAQFSGGVERPVVTAQDVAQFGRTAA